VTHKVSPSFRRLNVQKREYCKAEEKKKTISKANEEKN
jgi:hypothetical protein